LLNSSYVLNSFPHNAHPYCLFGSPGGIIAAVLWRQINDGDITSHLVLLTVSMAN